MRPDAVTVAAISLMTCPDACYQAPHSRVRFVVVLAVMSSVRSALSARASQIRAETKGRGCRPPVSVQVSGPSCAARPVVYKTAAQPTQRDPSWPWQWSVVMINLAVDTVPVLRPGACEWLGNCPFRAA